MKIREYVPRVKYYVDIFELPKYIQKIIRELAYHELDMDYNIVDYMDGDFYYLIDLSCKSCRISRYFRRYIVPDYAIEDNKFAVWVWH